MNKFYVYTLGLFASLIVLGVSSNPVNAAVTLNPDPGPNYFPADTRAYFESADAGANTPTVASWLTSASQPTSRSITVPQGTTSISLRFGTGAAVGFTPSNTTRLRATVVSSTVSSAGATTAGINGTSNTAVLTPNESSVGRFGSGWRNFTVNKPTGFNSTENITVVLNARTVNEFYGGTYYRCTANNTPTTDLNGANCPVDPYVFTIRVEVVRNPVDLSGRVFDINTGNGVAGATVFFCGTNGTTTTDANGNYTKTLDEGDGYCVRVIAGAPAGSGPHARPRGDDYQFAPSGTCRDYDTGSTIPDYCAAIGYECQIAGLDSYACGFPNTDRSVDTGLDLVYNVPPAPVPSVDAIIDLPAEAYPGETVPYTYRGRNTSTNMTYQIDYTNAGSNAAFPASSGTSGSLAPSATAILGSGNVTIPGNALPGTPICTTLKVDSVSTPSATDTEVKCMIVVSTASVTVESADIAAGAAFHATGQCDSDLLIKSATYDPFGTEPLEDRGIHSRLRNRTGGGVLGSIVEYGAFATGPVDGLGTHYAQRGPADTTLSEQLLFSNTATDKGYNFGRTPTVLRCIHNYYRMVLTQAQNTAARYDYQEITGSNNNRTDALRNRIRTPSPASSGVGVSFIDGDQTFSNLTVGGNQVEGQHIIIVNGDITIDGDILYEEPFPGTQPTDIPALVVIACGNISINEGVTQVYGMYIAQPRDSCDPGVGGGGKIYTCSILAITGLCNQQLNIYGSFIAQKLYLRRSYNSYLNQLNNPRQQSLQFGAEAFHFKPEVFIADPLRTFLSNATTDFSTYRELPPQF